MSVRKRKWTSGGVEKEAWVADYVDGSAKRHQMTFDRKKDADAYHATVRVEVREGTHVADSASVTVSKAGEFWIASAVAAGLERTTVDQYRQHLKYHIDPFIGGALLSRLTVPTVRAFEDRLRREGRSPMMVRKVLGSLGALVGDAQERGLASRNPVRDMRGRRRRGKERQAVARQRGKLKVGLDIPTPDEIRAILRAAQVKGGWAWVFIVTAIFTGLRASELRGLRWTDVDLERGEIHVRQRADRYNQIGPPKSEAGERRVPIGQTVVNALREWRLACPRPFTGERDALGRPLRETANPEQLVFPNGRGNVESLGNIINRVLIPLLMEAGVTVASLDEVGRPKKDSGGQPLLKAKYMGMHALRHFYASWCINSVEDGGLGISPKLVQEYLGHSSILMTMDVYGHLFPAAHTSEKFDRAETILLGISM